LSGFFDTPPPQHMVLPRITRDTRHPDTLFFSLFRMGFPKTFPILCGLAVSYANRYMYANSSAEDNPDDATGTPFSMGTAHRAITIIRGFVRSLVRLAATRPGSTKKIGSKQTRLEAI
jgi:hypothetical protein